MKRQRGRRTRTGQMGDKVEGERTGILQKGLWTLTVHVPDDILDAVVPGVSHYAAREGRRREKIIAEDVSL